MQERSLLQQLPVGPAAAATVPAAAVPAPAAAAVPASAAARGVRTPHAHRRGAAL